MMDGRIWKKQENVSALGKDQAKITIVEFADYQYSFCTQFNKETKEYILQSDFIRNENFIYYVTEPWYNESSKPSAPL